MLLFPANIKFLVEISKKMFIKIKDIDSRLAKLETKIGGERTQEMANFKEVTSLLPIDDINQLLIFDRKLDEDTNFQKVFVSRERTFYIS